MSDFRSWDAIVTDLETVTAEARAKADAEGEILPPDPPDPPDPPIDPITRVYAGGDLQAALDGGGIVQIMDAGSTFDAGIFTVTKNFTELRGNSALLTANAGPALRVAPGVHHVQVRDIRGASSTYSAVFELGRNSKAEQGTLDRVPHHLVFERVYVPTHRRQRGFEINAGDVEILNCGAVDVWNSIIVDSQALCILNATGPILVDGGEWSAASECIMVGGAAMQLPAGTTPTGLTFKNLHIFKPQDWKTDGVKRGVKNLLELKSGTNVSIENCLLENTWTDAQVSCGIVITPRNGLNVSNVTIDRCTVRNAGMGINILGVNDAVPHNDTPTDHVVVKNSTFLIDHKLWGGKGCYAQFLNNAFGAIGSFETDNCYILGTAGYYVMYATQAGYTTAGDPPVKTPNPSDLIRITRSRLQVPFYNNAATWFQSGSAPLGHVVKAVDIQGCEIGSGSTRLKTDYPNNTFLTAAEFAALAQEPPNPTT